MRDTRVLAVSVEPQLIQLRQSGPGRENLMFFRTNQERLGPTHIGWLRREGMEVEGMLFGSVAVCGFRSVKVGYGILDIMEAAYLCANCQRVLGWILERIEEEGEACIDHAP